jgi:hypothetical protein
MNYDTWFMVLIITEKMSVLNMNINGWEGAKTAYVWCSYLLREHEHTSMINIVAIMVFLFSVCSL